jgi:copper chaperone CopZ
MLRTMLRCGIALAAMMVALGSCRFVLAEDHNHDHTMTFTVKGMCCEKEAGPVVAELEKVKGVAKVKGDPTKGTLAIEPKPKTDPSPKEIWEAVEKAKVTPVKLATAHETFIKKPKKWS